MELSPSGTALSFEVTFDSPTLPVAMSVYDDSGSSPVLVQGPTAMLNVVGNTYRGKFTPASGRSYIIFKAVYTDHSYQYLSSDYSQGSESIIASYSGSSSAVGAPPVLGYVENPNQVIGANGGYMNWDDFSVGPQTAPMGPAILDWAQYPPTFTGFGSPTAVSISYKRIGDTLYLRGAFTLGTTTSATASMTLPAGLAVASTVGANQVVGKANGSTYSTTYFSGLTVIASGGATTVNFGGEYSTGGGQNLLLGNTLLPSGSVVNIMEAIIPVTGWSSNSAMSSDTDTRVISAQAGCSTAFAYSATVPINFDTVTVDRAGSITTSPTAWKYTASVSGDYRVSTSLINGTGSISVFLYKNGSSYRTLMSVTTSTVTSASTTVTLNAGDYIDIRGASAATLLSGVTTNTISIERLSGPAVISATESVNGSYTDTSGRTVTTSFTNFTYNTLIKDTHSAFNGTTLTIPVSGQYRFTAVWVSNSVTLSVTQYEAIQIKRNGTSILIGTVYGNGGAGVSYTVPAIVSYPCNAGDTIVVQAMSQVSTAATSLSAYNFFSWERVGN